MGVYLNPGNDAFRQIRNGIYVDKTGLIDYINGTIGTPFNLTCFSRPRRFGKSFAAMMLSAYYDRSCDSGELFSDLRIAGTASYETHLNQYDVIYLDITWFISRAGTNVCDVVSEIQTAVIDELSRAFPDCVKQSETFLPDVLLKINRKTKERFFVIIDEWDALFREMKDDEKLQSSYIQFLRGLFKSGPAMKSVIAGAYMTGILPIKKYGTQSALTDFKEYSMVDPLALSEYVGFTEQEVQMLCDKYHVDFDRMKQWYDGYSFADTDSVYSPNSVMGAVNFGKFKSYWTSSETYESLKDYICRNFDGLKDTIVRMLGGQRECVDIGTFQNDMTSFHSRDDILTLLIHLGYLAFDEREMKAYIPNQEVSDAFRLAVKGTDWKEVNQALSRSETLLKATVNQDCEAVAAALELAHETCASTLSYNDENSLACAIMLAYYTVQNYYEIVRELPAGKGFADCAFIPRRNTDKPAMMIELKCDRTADSAIQQIKDRRYAGRLKDYAGELLLVGINYDKKSKGKELKRHTCVIERI
ncbi:MAG: ATP-binding protein [Clostridiales bacterium]|nr:ATP-binding protein [Clostridiales bacterium]